MKTLHIILFTALTLLLFQCENDSKPFRIKSDQVREGDYLAKVISPSQMTSNYPMDLDNSIDQPILFKLSLNGRDNEGGIGMDHLLVIPDDITEYYTPSLQFGVYAPALAGDKPKLTQNSNVHFRVDLRPILKSFSKAGFYVTPTRDTISVDSFTGLYLAGGTSPLKWLWDNPDNISSFKFEDVDQDSIFELTIHFELPNQTDSERSWTLSRDLSAFPRFTSPQAPLLEALTNMALEEGLMNIREDEAFSAGKEWEGVWTRDLSYAAQLSLAYLYPENMKTSLRMKLNSDGRIIQDTGTGGSWPISSDRHVWTLAAWEIFLATGDKTWLEEIRDPVINALKEDLLWNRDPVSGMLLGETSFEDWREQTYPPWMSSSDIHTSHALSTNIIFKRALEVGLFLARDNDEIIRTWPELITRLDQNILNHFWSESLNAPASYIIASPAWLASSHRDILGESLGILYCNSFSPINAQLVASYPRTEYGSPVISHQSPHSPPYHNKAIWPFVEAYSLLAAKKVGNDDVYKHSFDGLIRAAALFMTHRENYHYTTGRPDQTEINSDRQLWSVGAWLGAIYKGLFGISINYDFDRDGFDLLLEPNNPFQWDEFNLTHLTLHDTPINIHLTGKGSSIKSMLVNDIIHENKSIPLTGDPLDIVIELMENKDHSDASLTLADHQLPEAPRTQLIGDTLYWANGADQALIGLNGQILDTLMSSPIILPDSISGFLFMKSIDSTGAQSLPSKPFYLGPSATLMLNSAAPYYIEVGEENASISMNFSLPSTGNYLLRFIYSNGMGPINTGNTCGLAKLTVNDWWLEQMISFPHTESWNLWQATAWAKAQFQAGENSLILDQETLPVTNMNGEQNLFRVQSVEIIPVFD